MNLEKREFIIYYRFLSVHQEAASYSVGMGRISQVGETVGELI
jgi:hypothetical protein